jgi:hypothetical protein
MTIVCITVTELKARSGSSAHCPKPFGPQTPASPSQSSPPDHLLPGKITKGMVRVQSTSMLNGIVMAPTALPIRINHDGHNTVMSTPTMLRKRGTPKNKNCNRIQNLCFPHFQVTSIEKILHKQNQHKNTNM